jgi:hypothetical protein
MEGNTTYRSFAYLDNYAPAEGETVYYNTEKNLSKSKNDCEAGIGSSVTLLAPANKFVSNLSTNDANEQAQEWLNTNSQAYANNLGTCVIDSTPPNSFYLSQTSITPTTVLLSWLPAIDNIGVVAYDIFIDDSFLDSISSNVFSYAVTELSPSTTYNFYIKAKDAAGNSTNSNILAVTTLPITLILPVTNSVIFENKNSNWLACHDADAATTYYQGNAYLGAAKDASGFTLNRYRGAIDTSLITSTPKSAKIRFKFASNTVGNALTFNLFYSNIFSLHAYTNDFQLIDWNDWDSSTFLGSVTVPSNSTAYVEITLNPAHFYLLTQREGFNFFLISNGDKDMSTPTTNNRPILSTTTDTGEIYLECEI